MELRRTLLVLLAAVAIVSSLYADDSRTSVAFDGTRGFLDRIRRVGNPGIPALDALPEASPSEVYTVHHPVSLRPVTDLVSVRSPGGRLVAVVGVDTENGRMLWCDLSCADDRVFPVNGADAQQRLRARREGMGRSGELGRPLLVQGADKRLYWRFGSAGETWLVDAFEAGRAPIPGEHETFRRAVTPAGGPLKTDESTQGSLGGSAETPDMALLGALPSAYVFAGHPYHYQITSWYCGPAALQMNMDYWGEEVGQHDIADVANDIVDYGVYSGDIRRAAHFSGMSTCLQNPALRGYAERQLGYACPDRGMSAYPDPGKQLKRIVSAGQPAFTLTWFGQTHTAGHYRVVKGWDDNLDVFVLDDPWYSGYPSGPDLLIDQTLFVDDLWVYSDRWCMSARPWTLELELPGAVSQGDTFYVDLKVVYPGPAGLSGIHTCTSCEATIGLPAGLVLGGGSSTVSLADMASGDSTTVTWEVIAQGGAGEYGIAFQAQGLVRESSNSYSSYTDSIGGHGYETIEIGGSLLADGWDPEERLTGDAGSSQPCFPGARAMALGPDGSLHLVWADTRDGHSSIYYRKRTSGTWEAEVRLTDSEAHACNPSIAVGADGGVHVAYVQDLTGNPEVFYLAWDTVGGWSAPEQVTAYGEVDDWPSIAAGGGCVSIAWERRMGGFFRATAVFFSRREAGLWTTPVDVDDSPARDSYRPSLAWGGEGLLHLAYERQTSNDPDELEKIVYRSWDGLAWSGRTGISDNIGYSRGPCLTTGPDSSIHIVWQDADNGNADVFYRRYDGAVWQPTEQIAAGGTEASTPSIAVDGSGDAHVVWSDHRHGAAEIYLMSCEAGTWSGEIRMTEATEPSILPHIDAGPAGDLYVSWADMRHGDWDIYFRKKTDVSGVPGTNPADPVSPLALARPYPQPCVGKAHLAFTLADPAEISLRVFDVEGRQVRRLAEGHFRAGTHSVLWDGVTDRGIPAVPGVYFVRCTGGGGGAVTRIVLIR
jgi:hypothetical protein